MLKGEEFRKISSLSIQSVPRFFELQGGGNVIAVDRVKMEVAISTPLHRVGALRTWKQTLH